jgi:hypothetical protein
MLIGGVIVFYVSDVLLVSFSQVCPMYDMWQVLQLSLYNAAFFVLWGCVVRPGFYKLLQCVGVFESYFLVCVPEYICDFPYLGAEICEDCPCCACLVVFGLSVIIFGFSL